MSQTALRDLRDLMAFGLVDKVGTTGRNTRYRLRHKPDIREPYFERLGHASGNKYFLKGDIMGPKGTFFQVRSESVYKRLTKDSNGSYRPEAAKESPPQKRKLKETVSDLPLKVKAEMVLKEAVAEALAEHKPQGNPIAVWRNGKAVWIPPEEIVVPEV